MTSPAGSVPCSRFLLWHHELVHAAACLATGGFPLAVLVGPCMGVCYFRGDPDPFAEAAPCLAHRELGWATAYEEEEFRGAVLRGYRGHPLEPGLRSAGFLRAARRAAEWHWRKSALLRAGGCPRVRAAADALREHSRGEW